jgi:hypothetical protein
VLLSHHLRQTPRSLRTRPDSHLGSHLTPTWRKILPFFSCGYGNAFCNPFVFRSMHVMGWGVPPSAHSFLADQVHPAPRRTLRLSNAPNAQISRRRSLFNSSTYRMLSAQPFSFVYDTFSWVGCTLLLRKVQALEVRTSERSDVPTSPIAVRNYWCHNPQRHQISSPSGETSPLPPVSKDTRAESGNCSTTAPGRKSCLGSTF